MLKDYQGCPRPTLPGVKVETDGGGEQSQALLSRCAFWACTFSQS